jgi:competence protein ComEC
MKWWIVRKKVHVSWLVGFGSLGIICGVIGAQHYSGFSSVSWLIAGIVLLGACLWIGRVYAFLFVFIAGASMGLWRGALLQNELAPYVVVIGTKVVVVGEVSEDTDIGKGGVLLLRLGVKTVNGHDFSGNIWVSAKTEYDIKRSDIVTVQGVLTDGFGSFSASMYRADIQKVQRPQPGDIALQVRDGFAEYVRQAVPDPEASLGIGYLVGQRRALPPDLDEALRIAGLTHIVVASGYNLTILVRLARRLFMKLSKFTAAAASGGLIISFMAVTGMSPSMARAGLVSGLSLAAWYYGRSFHPLVLLPFAAAVTLLINPGFGWGIWVGSLVLPHSPGS